MASAAPVFGSMWDVEVRQQRIMEARATTQRLIAPASSHPILGLAESAKSYYANSNFGGNERLGGAAHGLKFLRSGESHPLPPNPFGTNTTPRLLRSPRHKLKLTAAAAKQIKKARPTSAGWRDTSELHGPTGGATVPVSISERIAIASVPPPAVHAMAVEAATNAAVQAAKRGTSNAAAASKPRPASAASGALSAALVRPTSALAVTSTALVVVPDPAMTFPTADARSSAVTAPASVSKTPLSRTTRQRMSTSASARPSTAASDLTAASTHRPSSARPTFMTQRGQTGEPYASEEEKRAADEHDRNDRDGESDGDGGDDDAAAEVEDEVWDSPVREKQWAAERAAAAAGVQPSPQQTGRTSAGAPAGSASATDMLLQSLLPFAEHPESRNLTQWLDDLHADHATYFDDPERPVAAAAGSSSGRKSKSKHHTAKPAAAASAAAPADGTAPRTVHLISSLGLHTRLLELVSAMQKLKSELDLNYELLNAAAPSSGEHFFSVSGESEPNVVAPHLQHRRASAASTATPSRANSRPASAATTRAGAHTPTPAFASPPASARGPASGSRPGSAIGDRPPNTEFSGPVRVRHFGGQHASQPATGRTLAPPTDAADALATGVADASAAASSNESNEQFEWTERVNELLRLAGPFRSNKRNPATAAAAAAAAAATASTTTQPTGTYFPPTPGGPRFLPQIDIDTATDPATGRFSPQHESITRQLQSLIGHAIQRYRSVLRAVHHDLNRPGLATIMEQVLKVLVLCMEAVLQRERARFTAMENQYQTVLRVHGRNIHDASDESHHVLHSMALMIERDNQRKIVVEQALEIEQLRVQAREHEKREANFKTNMEAALRQHSDAGVTEIEDALSNMESFIRKVEDNRESHVHLLQKVKGLADDIRDKHAASAGREAQSIVSQTRLAQQQRELETAQRELRREQTELKHERDEWRAQRVGWEQQQQQQAQQQRFGLRSPTALGAPLSLMQLSSPTNRGSTGALNWSSADDSKSAAANAAWPDTQRLSAQAAAAERSIIEKCTDIEQLRRWLLDKTRPVVPPEALSLAAQAIANATAATGTAVAGTTEESKAAGGTGVGADAKAADGDGSDDENSPAKVLQRKLRASTPKVIRSILGRHKKTDRSFTVRQLNQLIVQLYYEKIAVDNTANAIAASVGLESAGAAVALPVTVAVAAGSNVFAEFILSFFLQRYGLKSLAEAHLAELCRTVRTLLASTLPPPPGKRRHKQPAPVPALDRFVLARLTLFSRLLNLYTERNVSSVGLDLVLSVLRTIQVIIASDLPKVFGFSPPAATANDPASASATSPTSGGGGGGFSITSTGGAATIAAATQSNGDVKAADARTMVRSLVIGSLVSKLTKPELERQLKAGAGSSKYTSSFFNQANAIAGLSESAGSGTAGGGGLVSASPTNAAHKRLGRVSATSTAASELLTVSLFAAISAVTRAFSTASLTDDALDRCVLSLESKAVRQSDLFRPIPNENGERDRLLLHQQIVNFIHTRRTPASAGATALVTTSGSGGGGRDIGILFERFDKNKNGTLDVNEMRAGFQTLNPVAPLNEREVNTLITILDPNARGRVTFPEFVATFAKNETPLLHLDDVLDAVIDAWEWESATATELYTRWFRDADRTNTGSLKYRDFYDIILRFDKSKSHAQSVQLFEAAVRAETEIQKARAPPPAPEPAADSDSDSGAAAESPRRKSVDRGPVAPAPVAMTARRRAKRRGSVVTVSAAPPPDAATAVPPVAVEAVDLQTAVIGLDAFLLIARRHRIGYGSGQLVLAGSRSKSEFEAFLRRSRHDPSQQPAISRTASASSTAARGDDKELSAAAETDGLSIELVSPRASASASASAGAPATATSAHATANPTSGGDIIVTYTTAAPAPDTGHAKVLSLTSMPPPSASAASPEPSPRAGAGAGGYARSVAQRTGGAIVRR